MQVLKDSVKKSILSAAKKEFRRKGYSAASLRIIAGDAGITVGNMYRYFTNKENLFETLIEPVLNEINKHLAEHEDFHNSCIKNYDEFQKIHESKMDFLFWFIRNFKDEFIILMEGSQGSKFENRGEILTSWIKNHTYTQLKNWYVNEDDEWVHLFALAISRSFMEGLMEIIKNSENFDTIISVLKSFSESFNTGFERYIINKPADAAKNC